MDVEERPLGGEVLLEEVSVHAAKVRPLNRQKEETMDVFTVLGCKYNKLITKKNQSKSF